MDKAIENIVSNIKDIDDAYAQSIAAYALQLADHPSKDEILDKLVEKTIVKGKIHTVFLKENLNEFFFTKYFPSNRRIDQQKWWTRSHPGPNVRQSKSIDVEITAYGVLALIEAKRFAEALPYFKWLLAQRNDKGGFVGTQDTVIGLEALATYGRLITSKDNDVLLKISAENVEKSFDVKADNSLVLQKLELPSETKSVHLTASGKGFALFQLSYRYNLNESDVYTTFTLQPKVLETTAGHLNVEVCAKFVHHAFKVISEFYLIANFPFIQIQSKIGG